MYVPTIIVVDVVVDGFFVGKFWFLAPYAVMAGIGPDINLINQDTNGYMSL